MTAARRPPRRRASPCVVLVTSRTSGAGKTTLVAGLIPALRALGLRVAAVKLSHHDVELDPPGKDSRRLRDAGAEAVVLCGPTRLTVFAASDVEGAPPLRRVVAAASLLAGRPDVVVVEGGRSLPGFPRIEIVAPGESPVSSPETLVAIACDEVPEKASARAGAPVHRRDDYAGLAACVATLVAARITSRETKARTARPRPSAEPAQASGRASSGGTRGRRR